MGEFGDRSVNVREEENNTLGEVNTMLVSNKIFKTDWVRSHMLNNKQTMLSVAIPKETVLITGK